MTTTNEINALILRHGPFRPKMTQLVAKKQGFSTHKSEEIAINCGFEKALAITEAAIEEVNKLNGAIDVIFIESNLGERSTLARSRKLLISQILG